MPASQHLVGCLGLDQSNCRLRHRPRNNGQHVIFVDKLRWTTFGSTGILQVEELTEYNAMLDMFRGMELIPAGNSVAFWTPPLPLVGSELIYTHQGVTLLAFVCFHVYPHTPSASVSTASLAWRLRRQDVEEAPRPK